MKSSQTRHDAGRLAAIWARTFHWPVTTAHVVFCLELHATGDADLNAMRTLILRLCRVADGRPLTSRRLGCMLRGLRRRRLNNSRHFDTLPVRTNAGNAWLVQVHR